METEQKMEPQQMEQIFGLLAIFEARLDEWLKDLKNIREETMACQEAMVARLGKEEPTSADMKACQDAMEANLEGKEEPASEEIKPEVADDQEVPREDAAVMPVRGLRKQRRGRKQAAGRRKEPKELNRGICGSREKLAAACKKVSRRATVAWRRRNILRKSWTRRSCGLRKEVTAAGMRITRCAGHGRKGRNKEIVIERNRIRRREPKNERSKGTRSRHVEELLHLRKKRKSTNNIDGMNPGERAPLGSVGKRKKGIGDIFSEIKGHVVGTSSGLRGRKKWTLWRGRPPPKRKNQQH
jgi:hypothetical protein